MRAAIVGIAGLVLTPDEAALFRRHPPAGIILFARNIDTPEQLAALMASLPADAVRLVDQEGGRVARLRPPHWRAHPPAAALTTDRAAWLTGALIGLDCLAAGFAVACAPVLDLRVAGAASVVGDRSFGADPALVAARGRAFAEGMMAAGVQPVIKHMPGHGRAAVDSHAALPRVTETALDDDIAPFRALADLGWGMTAHIVYDVWDRQRPATLSPVVIDTIIRGVIGFEGVLVSDDLAMGALRGLPEARAAAALAAGCDLALFCPGILAETARVLETSPEVAPVTRHRLDRARAQVAAARRTLDGDALAAERDRLLA